MKYLNVHSSVGLPMYMANVHIGPWKMYTSARGMYNAQDKSHTYVMAVGTHTFICWVPDVQVITHTSRVSCQKALSAMHKHGW